jgi:AraC family transcriptional regulator
LLEAVLRDIAGRYEKATGARPLCFAEGAGGLFAAKWRLPRYRTASVWAPHHLLGYRASGIAAVTRRCCGGEQRKVPVIGSVTFSPGDQSTEWACDAPTEVIHVYIAEDTLRRFAGAEPDAAAAPHIRDFFAINDPWLARYFGLLDTEWRLYPGDTLFLRQTEHLLLRHLVRHYSDAPAIAGQAGSVRISPLQRSVTRSIEAYIDGHLGADVSLHTLAALAHMSVDHFVRAFRAATGKTPHRFVLDQRLTRAAAMLKAQGASIADIARACGFRSAAHFSVKFRARLGVTPSQYRRSP